MGMLRYRGVIEGFYGPMWSHEERLHLLRHMPEWRMNLYIYSPRDDPYHRFRWDAPYPAEEMARFAELAAEARRQDVQFAYAISPGNTFQPCDPAHRKALLEKLQAFVDLGCTFFPIFYDDLVEEFAPEGEAGVRHAELQAAVMNALAGGITARCPDARFLFCPTQYMTAEKSRYLCRLHELLDRRIETVVTGVDADTDGICPRTFSDEGAQRYYQHFGRRPFLWDNFNVRDNALNVLHWSPYAGRGRQLDQLCTGIVLNPQNAYLLNMPIFGCLGDYFADPRAYDPRASFRRHVTAFMGEEGAPFGEVLSQWFTSEWFASAGSGFLSSEQNLPLLPAEGVDRSTLDTLRQTLAPLCDLDSRFRRALMPPQVAACLLPYANLLAEYALAMVQFCDAAIKTTPPGDAGARLLARVARPETECFRLPVSLIDYAKQLIRGCRPLCAAVPTDSVTPLKRC
jgi:hypothetical protein